MVVLWLSDSKACAETMMTWELVARLESEQAPGRQQPLGGERWGRQSAGHMWGIFASGGHGSGQWSEHLRAVSACARLPAGGRCICEPLLWKVRSLRCKALTLSGSKGVIEPRVHECKDDNEGSRPLLSGTAAVKHGQTMGNVPNCSSRHRQHATPLLT
jgi:hypothetical protein